MDQKILNYTDLFHFTFSWEVFWGFLGLYKGTGAPRLGGKLANQVLKIIMRASPSKSSKFEEIRVMQRFFFDHPHSFAVQNGAYK